MGTGTARLHDVVRTWLRCQLGTASLAELDGALVAGYRARCRGTWYAVPDDGYALQHLPSHLRTANEAAWRKLLLDPRWIARKLTALGTMALVADYEPVVGDELRLIGDALRLFHGTRRPASAHLKGHAGPVNAVAVTPDGRQAVSASWGR